MYIYIYTYTYIYKHTYIYKYIYICIYAYLVFSIYISTYKYKYIYIYIRVYTYIYTHIDKNIYIHKLNTDIHTYCEELILDVHFCFLDKYALYATPSMNVGRRAATHHSPLRWAELRACAPRRQPLIILLVLALSFITQKKNYIMARP